MRVLLVEDNQELAAQLSVRFNRDGCALDWEQDGREAFELLRHKSFDLVILDINLPRMSGIEILSKLREQRLSIPVIVLTARSQVSDRIDLLDIGADDYLTKPFEFGELAARCRAVLRRRAGQSSNRIHFARFEYDRNSKLAYVDGDALALQAREVQMLELFLGNLGKLLSKEDVADRIYTFSETPSLNAVEQTVTRLRKKLDGSGFEIRTVRGLGYLASIND
ncbi:transcriptional regulatory protein (plasmid) [Maritalea myrionectae]|uniref:Transcriptional regulatory protein n=1 Tax=Maritalea myrionectae TaxID=454601 RepID=A0A2R4MJ98_9HYPH|nr:response regulator transcription factor [Maritalea myrionectae]AVX06057.1 transcriptional regulatory protein [Maritalea myrionectae]